MLAKRHENLQKAVRSALDKVKTGEGFSPLVEEILTRVIYKVIGQYQNKVNAGMQDSVSDLLNSFKQKVATQIFESADSWRVRNRDEFLFPPNCRYCYSRGESTILVIEQQPAVRSLLFYENLLGRDYGSMTGTKRVPLSLPYVYFFMHFRRHENNDVVSGVYTAWSNTSIVSLDDRLGRPVLPNTHPHCNVCMGWTPMRGNNIIELTNNTITTYWNSTFSSDLADLWWAKSNVDRRIATGNEWMKNSEDNPLFILSVDWPFAYTVRGLLDLLTRSEMEPSELATRHKLTDTVDKCVETLYSKILRYFKRTSFERFYPKESADQLSQAIGSVVGEMSDLLLALEHEVNKLAEDIQDASPTRWKKRGEFWRDCS